MKKFLILLSFLSFVTIPALAEEITPLETNSPLVEENVITQNKMVDYKTFKISSVNPEKISKKDTGLIIYTSLYGKSTNSDKKGFEAVVVNNKVTKLNQYDSYIPENGFVISGQGEAKKFILDNLFEGADVDIDFNKSELKVTIYQDNYVHEATHRLEHAKNILKNSNPDKVNTYNMNFYINRSETILTLAKKFVLFEDYENAKKMANDSMLYSDMAIYSSTVYNPDEFKGIWVFPYQKNEEEVKQAYEIIHRLNVDNIFIDAYYNGATIYPSEVAQKYGTVKQQRYFKDFDPLQAWIDIAKKENKKVYVSLKPLNMGNPAKSTFDTHILSIHPQWKNMTKAKAKNNNVLALDPANNEVQTYFLELTEEILSKYEVAGININGMKYPTAKNKNEIWGLTKVARKEFKTLYGTDPNKLSPQDEKWQKWELYKEQKITEFANKIIALNEKYPNIDISFTITPEAKDFSQNITKWNLNEKIKIVPILTSSDNDFAQEFLSEIKEQTAVENVYPLYLEPFMEEKPRKLFDQITTARKLNINGIILYDLDYLTKEYYDALRLCIFLEPKKEKSKSLLSEQLNQNKKNEQTEIKE